MTYFILLSGFGFGNAARQVAVIEALLERDPQAQIRVYSWGKGFEFLSQFSFGSQVQINCLFYPTTKVFQNYVGQLLLAILTFLFFYPWNSIYLWREKKKYLPRTVIFDSDYHFLVFLTSSVKRYSVNQAPDIYQKGKSASFSFLWRRGFIFSYLIETIDYLFQNACVDLFFCPTFSKKTFSNRKVKSVSLIVRKAFRLSVSLPNSAQSPAVLMGGSGIQSDFFKRWAREHGLHFIQSRGGHFFDAEKELYKYNPLITQGGLSSLSEALALKKALWVLPLKGHWEQFLNCQELESLGLARIIKDMDVIPYDFASSTEIQCSGADEIAQYLVSDHFGGG